MPPARARAPAGRRSVLGPGRRGHAPQRAPAFNPEPPPLLTASRPPWCPPPPPPRARADDGRDNTVPPRTDDARWAATRGAPGHVSARGSPPHALTPCARSSVARSGRPTLAVDGPYPRPRTQSLAYSPRIHAARAPVPHTTPRTRPGHPEKTKGAPPREGRSAPRYRASYCVAASTGACTSVMSTTSTGQVTKLRCRAADSTAGASFPQAPDARVRKARRGALDAPLPSPHRRRRSRSSISRLTSWDASSFSAGPLTGAWRGPGLPCPRAARRSGA